MFLAAICVMKTRTINPLELTKLELSLTIKLAIALTIEVTFKVTMAKSNKSTATKKPEKEETKSMSSTLVERALNTILELELSGVIRYTHYALMVYGYNRIPIVSWLRGQATESLDHANKAGELLTHLGAHPSLAIGSLLESQNHDIGEILRESLDHENETLSAYKKLLQLVDGKSVMLEEYAREMIYAEEMHMGEVDKMLRKPGEIGAFQK